MLVGSNPHLPDPVASKEEITQNKSSLLLLALWKWEGWLVGYMVLAGGSRESPTHGALAVGASLLKG